MSESSDQMNIDSTRWKNFSENDEVERLLNGGIENISMAFNIDKEVDIEGNPVNSKISWLKFESPEYDGIDGKLPSIEGKLYEPNDEENSNGELIIFTPGFPGGNAGRFEQRYAQAFVDAGYSFFTIRHNGTSLTNGEVSTEIVNSVKRTDIAKLASEHHIGGTREDGYRPDQMIDEPVTAILSLQKKFQKIHLMGQSMGVSSGYNAVTKLESNKQITDKLGNIVGIAGYVGREKEMPDGVWQGMKDFKGEGKYPDGMDGLIAYELDYIKSVDLNCTLNAEEFKDSLIKIANANEKMMVPDHVGNILIFTPEDPLITGPEETEDGVSKYGPESKRKIIIRDETGLGEKRPHSMLWIKPENLIRAVQAKISDQGPHYIKIPNLKDGMLEKA